MLWRFQVSLSQGTISDGEGFMMNEKQLLKRFSFTKGSRHHIQPIRSSTRIGDVHGSIRDFGLL